MVSKFNERCQASPDEIKNGIDFGEHLSSHDVFFPFPALVEGRQSNPEDNSYTLDWFSVFTQYSGEQLPGGGITNHLKLNILYARTVVARI